MRKNFPQRLGLLMVIAAVITFFILAARPATFTWGLIVLATVTVVDALLYMVVGKVTTCYRCRTDFKDHLINPQHKPFDLATSEKYRNTHADSR